ncbi:hypothetical protein G6F31_020893 [Rhizopus arrhizus]|nr:hypothetical protein G6F31_020893 [Rhizopus arrhizus]
MGALGWGLPGWLPLGSARPRAGNPMNRDAVRSTLHRPVRAARPRRGSPPRSGGAGRSGPAGAAGCRRG